MNWRDALNVLFNGLPPVKTRIEWKTKYVSVPPGAIGRKVFYAEQRKFHYGYTPPWEGKYFRTCADAFDASDGAATVVARDAFVAMNGDILIGSFSTYRFFGEEGNES